MACGLVAAAVFFEQQFYLADDNRLMANISKLLPAHAAELARRYSEQFSRASDFGWEFSLKEDSFVPESLAFPALVHGRARTISNGSALPQRPRYTREEIAIRHLYARGGDDRRTALDIERMMQRLIDSGIEFQLNVTRKRARRGGKRSVRKSSRRIKKSFEARAILETALGSRLTLMDLVELLDVTSEPIYLKGVNIDYFANTGPSKIIRVWGNYDYSANLDSQLETTPRVNYSLTLVIDGDGVSIASRNIDVSDYGRGHGFGARSLLALALFAKRHRISSWEDTAIDDGVFAWPTLGGELTEEGYRRIVGLLEEVWEIVRLGAIDIDNIEPDVSRIAEIELWDHDIENRETFLAWAARMLEAAEKEPADAEYMSEPYPIGLMVLEASSLTIRYRTERIVRHLLDDYFPGRILRRRIVSVSEGSTNSHRNFVEAYRRGLNEMRVVEGMEGTETHEPRILMPDMEKARDVPGWMIPARLASVVAPGEFAVPVGERSVAGALSFVGRDHPKALPTPVAFHSINLALRSAMDVKGPFPSAPIPARNLLFGRCVPTIPAHL